MTAKTKQWVSIAKIVFSLAIASLTSSLWHGIIVLWDIIEFIRSGELPKRKDKAPIIANAI